MVLNRKVVKIFLASPGDLADERKAAKEVVDEFNSLNADAFGYQLELVGWEDTVSGYGRPQEIINRELQRCELVIGILWMRWGTPPAIHGQYTSGFEEEFETSLQRRESDGRPEISLFFKEIESTHLRDPGPQLTTVLNFQKRVREEKKILYEGFRDGREFEKKFRRCITKFVEQLRSLEVSSGDQQLVPLTKGIDGESVKNTGLASDAPLSTKSRAFLKSFISKAEIPPSENPILPVEAARFRLLAGIVGTHGNDDLPLGVHDANLVFSNIDVLDLDKQEVIGLLESGLEHYSSESTPLWHWLKVLEGLKIDLLPICTVTELSPIRRINALTAMTLIEAPLPSDEDWDRESIINTWLEKNNIDSVKVAALTYLAACGRPSDLKIVRNSLHSESNQVVNAASEAVIKISLRDSKEKALGALLDLQPITIAKNILRDLFENDTAFSIESLKSALNHQNPDVRLEVIKILRKRKKYTAEMAEQSLSDSDVRIRYEALDSLIEAGRKFSVDEGEKVIVKKTESGMWGMLFSHEAQANKYLELFKQRRLLAFSKSELEKIAQDELIFEWEVFFLFAKRNGKKHFPLLRAAVDGEFCHEFETSLQILAHKYGADSSLVSKIRELEVPIRKKLTRKGLEILCNNGDPTDISRARKLLKSGYIDYSATDISYLEKNGEWEDISLIIQLIEKPPFTSLFGEDANTSSLKISRKAIYALGRNRLHELVRIPMPADLLLQLVIEIPDKSFNTIDRDWILSTLRSENEKLRKIVTVKCLKSFSKQTICTLLKKYLTQQDAHYYNVVHWLDFGISMPKREIQTAACKVLTDQT